MNTPASSASRKPGVGVSVIVPNGDRTLIVTRAKPPLQGYRAFPGGSVDWGETLTEAAIREVREETGLICEVRTRVDVLDAIGPQGDDGLARTHFVIVVFAAVRTGGSLQAASDALTAEFLNTEDLDPASCVPHLHRLEREARQRLGM